LGVWSRTVCVVRGRGLASPFSVQCQWPDLGRVEKRWSGGVWGVGKDCDNTRLAGKCCLWMPISFFCSKIKKLNPNAAATSGGQESGKNWVSLYHYSSEQFRILTSESADIYFFFFRSLLPSMNFVFQKWDEWDKPKVNIRYFCKSEVDLQRKLKTNELSFSYILTFYHLKYILIIRNKSKSNIRTKWIHTFFCRNEKNEGLWNIKKLTRYYTTTLMKRNENPQKQHDN